MRICIIAGLGAVALGCIAEIAQAQDCRTCTRQSSIQACIDCNMRLGAGRYTLQQSQKWCGKNQPLCSGQATKNK